MISRLLHIRLLSISLGFLILTAFAAQGQTIVFSSSPYEPNATTASALLGVAYTYDADATSTDGSRVRYSLRFGPAGMKVEPRTGVVSWQPTGEGEFDAEIRAELVDNPSVNTTQGWKITAKKALQHPGCTGNEAWLSVGKGLPGYAQSATVLNDELYVLHNTASDIGASARLSAWNGRYWRAVSDLNIGGDSLGQIIAYKGDIYLATTQAGIQGIPNSEGLAKWDGSSWSGVGLHDFNNVLDIEVVNGILYALVYDKTPNANNILEKWDGTNWETIQVIPEQKGIALASLNNRLYVACLPGALGLVGNELPLFQLNNGALEPVANNGIPILETYPTYDLVEHNGTLVFITGYLIFQWDGTKVEELEQIPNTPFINRSAISYKGELYVASLREKGPLPSFLNYEIWRLSGDDWKPVSGIQSLVISSYWAESISFIEYKNDLFAYGRLNQSCGAALNNVAVLGTEDECARVSGSVYHDDNRNCIVDPNEPNLKNEIVEILPGPFYVSTDNNGNFTTLLRPDTYSFQVSPKRHWMNSCPSPQEVTLASPAAVVNNVNIGTDMIPGIYDVRSSLAVGPARPGFDVTYTFTWWNIGTEPATGTAFFEYDSRLAFRSASLNPSRHNSNRLEWDFSNLPVGEVISVTITLNIPASITIGTELCAIADVQLDLKDNDRFLHDNVDELCTTVRGSYDPNNINVAPIRLDPEFGEAPLLPNDTILSYLVQFQNTGNDTAFTVIVADTLDASLLDITSIQLGAASHDFDFNISGAGILTWTFNNIMLPDSNVNEPASHGYFKYTIHLRRGLAPLTQIPNRASIYFDYNEPVLTNSVLSITSGTLGVEDYRAAASSMQIYPNPVRGRSIIQLNLSESAHVTLRLIDSRGEVVQLLAEGEMKGGEERITFDSEKLASGAYYLILDRDGSKEIYPIVIGK